MPAATIHRSPSGRAPRVLRHPLFLAGVPFVLFLGALIAISLAPSWRLDVLLLGTPGEFLQPISWSPDGTRFAVQRGEQFLIVGASDGKVLRTIVGNWPVWVDDNTIDALRDIGLQRTELRRIDLETGDSTTIAQPLPVARLTAGGGGLPLAATAVGRDIVTVVLTPIGGRRLAVLQDLRGISWVRPGILVLKTVIPELQAFGSLPGSLRAWSGGDVRLIGGRLIELRDTIAPSPSGQDFACVCADPGADGKFSDPAVYLVPLDGSAPTRLSEWVAAPTTADPLIAWLDDETLVFLDGAGMHRVDLRSRPLLMAGLDPGAVFTAGGVGRLYRIGDSLAVLETNGHGPTGVTRLTVIGPSGDVRFRRSFPSWNAAYLVVDPAHPRAILATDPQPPDGPSNRFFVLSYE
jgi:hypothetical protein